MTWLLVDLGLIRIAGGGNARRVQEVLIQGRGVAVPQGELSFPMMAIGACGLMNAVGNLMPGPVAELHV